MDDNIVRCKTCTHYAPFKEGGGSCGINKSFECLSEDKGGPKYGYHEMYYNLWEERMHGNHHELPDFMRDERGDIIYKQDRELCGRCGYSFDAHCEPSDACDGFKAVTSVLYDSDTRTITSDDPPVDAAYDFSKGFRGTLKELDRLREEDKPINIKAYNILREEDKEFFDKNQERYESALKNRPITITPTKEKDMRETAFGLTEEGFNKVQATSDVPREFDTGSVRDSREGKGRFDLVSPIAIKRIAQHYENGAKKYQDRNWEKGQPVMSYLDSAERHINTLKELKLKGMELDEDHLAAICWNIMAVMHVEEMVKCGLLPRDLLDYPEPQPRIDGRGYNDTRNVPRGVASSTFKVKEGDRILFKKYGPCEYCSSDRSECSC